jgi:tRNA (adenine57-N1/adenine58-N1)-methyltransferase
MTNVIQEGDYVLLYFDDRRKWLVKVTGEREFHTHKGVVKLSAVIGNSYGTIIKSSLNHRFWVLKPTTYDFIMAVERPTQIVYPKDTGIILVKLGLSPGSVVVEAGTGSGALTLAMANAVRPDGHVYSYEVRPEFSKIAYRNLRKAGVLDYVTIRDADARLGFEEKDADAVMIDLADPWRVIRKAYKCLKGGAPIASFSPTFNQIEKTVEALRRASFLDVETIECLLREIRVEKGKTRPVTFMVGHTGYITFAQKACKEKS